MSLFTNLFGRSPKTARKPQPTRLGVESLESREVLSAVPALHSLAGATAAVYLDFDGYTAPGTTVEAFSLDADRATINADEDQMIREIWARVAEDYSPFKIDVTTVQPAGGADGRYVRVAIGDTGGIPGWAPFKTFRDGNNDNNVAFVKAGDETDSNNYWKNSSTWAATASHEAGHILGLKHQSTYNADGTLQHAYAPGTSTRAPLMGNYHEYLPTGKTRTNFRATWSNGPTWGPTDLQDDMKVIAGTQNGFGYRTDESGKTFVTAPTLRPTSGVVVQPGVIAQTTDTDFYAFETKGGKVTITVTVTQVAHETLWPNGPRHLAANLDATLTVYRDNGTTQPTLVKSLSPTDSLGATYSPTLTAGRYFVVVGSQGQYGDAGQYTLRIKAPFTNYVINNGGAGYSETGTGWTTETGGSGGNVRLAPMGTGLNTAAFQLTGLGVRQYDVGVTWTAAANRATNATYKVYDGTTLIATVSVNQQNAPTGVTSGGVKFFSLGQFNISSGTLKVVLSDAANGVVVADAIRVTPL
jgi:hypothetical protein